MEKQKTTEQSANEFCDVKDVKGNFLYTNEGYIYIYVKVGFLNTALFSTAEFERSTTQITASYESDRKEFAYCAYPREIDLDLYKNNLKEKARQEQEFLGLKKILNVMMIQAMELSTSGENYEHYHFFKLWNEIPSASALPNIRQAMMERAREFCQRYETAGVSAEILKEKEIVKLCNLFGNSDQAPFDTIDDNLIYSPVMRIG